MTRTGDRVGYSIQKTKATEQSINAYNSIFQKLKNKQSFSLSGDRDLSVKNNDEQCQSDLR